MRLTGLFPLVALALPVVSGAAQTAAPSFGVRDAVAIARARHPLVDAAGGRRMMVEGSARQAAAWANPTVEWRSENLSSPLMTDEFLVASVPIDLTFRRAALGDARTAAVARARADSTTVMRTVELEAARAYWKAALADALAEVASAQRQALEGIAEFDAARLREGAVAEAAAMRTRLEADRSRMTEASARAEAFRSRAELARAIGIPVDSVPAPTEFPVMPGEALPDPDSVMRAALATRPELAAAREAVREARSHASAARRGVLGDVALIAGMKRTGGYDTRVLGVAVPLPLFDWNGGAREAAAGEVRMAAALARDAEARVRADVLSSLASYVALRSAAPMAAEARLDERGSEIARIALAAYREGGASLVELLEAQRAAADARATLLRWSVDVRLAKLDLERATGAPIVE